MDKINAVITGVGGYAVSYTHLLQPETVVFAEAAAVEEAGCGERAVQFDVLFALVAVYGFCHR